MEQVAVAKLKPGQVVTLEFGNRTATLTKLEEPGKFTVEDWFPEERELYLLDEMIEEGEYLHYSVAPLNTPLEAALKINQSRFGIQQTVFDFLHRPVDSIEMEEEEEEEDGDEE